MKRYKWLKRNLSEAQNGFFFFNFIYLFHLRFMQASLLGASSWPAIKLLYTLQWCKALKLAYRASWGQGTPPWCKAVYLVLPILPQNNPWSIPCAPPCHDGSLPFPTHCKPAQLRQPCSCCYTKGAPNPQKPKGCSALSTGRASPVPGARDFSCGTDMKAVTSCGLQKLNWSQASRADQRLPGVFPQMR